MQTEREQQGGGRREQEGKRVRTSERFKRQVIQGHSLLLSISEFHMLPKWVQEICHPRVSRTPMGQGVSPLWVSVLRDTCLEHHFSLDVVVALLAPQLQVPQLDPDWDPPPTGIHCSVPNGDGCWPSQHLPKCALHLHNGSVHDGLGWDVA